MSIEMKTAKNGSKYYTLYGINSAAEKELFQEISKMGMPSGKVYLKRIMVFENGSKLSIRIEGYTAVTGENGKQNKKNQYRIQENGQVKDLPMRRIAYNMGTINIKPHVVEVYSMEDKIEKDTEVFYGFRPGVIKAGDRRIRTISNNPQKLINKIQHVMKYSLYHKDVDQKRTVFYANLSKNTKKGYLMQGSDSMVIGSLFMNQLKDSVENKLFDIVWKTLKKNGYALRGIDPTDFDKRLGDLLLLARYPIQQELYHMAKAKFLAMEQPTLDQLTDVFYAEHNNRQINSRFDYEVQSKPTDFKVKFKWNSVNVSSSLNDAFRCKTIKQCVRRIFGNNGKQMTKIFMNSALHHRINDDRRTSVWKRDVHANIMIAPFEAGLIARRIFTVDHMQKLLAPPPQQTPSLTVPQAVATQVQTTFKNISTDIRASAHIGAWLNKNQKNVIFYSTPEQLEDAFFGEGSSRGGIHFMTDQRLHEAIGFKRLRPIGSINAVVQFFKMFSTDRAFRLWSSVNTVGEFEDTIRQWWIIKHLIEVPKDFKDMKAVHDFVSKEYRKIKQKDFALKFNEREDLKKLDGIAFCDMKTKRTLQIVTPKTNWEIVEWGQTLSNCIGSYGSQVNDKKDLSQILLGVNVDGKLTYALEVVHGVIRQFYGVRNSQPNKEDKDIVTMILNKYEIGRKDRISELAEALRADMEYNQPPARMMGLAEQLVVDYPPVRIAEGRPLEENHLNDAVRYAIGAGIRPDQPMMVNANMVTPEYNEDHEDF